MATPGFYNEQDQNIYDNVSKFMPQSKYLRSAPTFNEPVVEEVEESEAPSFGIPNTNAFTNSGGNNFNRSFSHNPYTAQPLDSFVTNRTSYGTTGYLPGTEPQPSKFAPVMSIFKKGLGMAIPGGNFLMGMAENQSRQNRLNATDNAFIDMQLANQEYNLHGTGNLTNQDRYGYAKVSGFGNYADKVKERADIARAKAKENINNPNYKVRPIDAYYLEKEKEFEDTKKKVEFNDFVRQRNIANKIREGIKNKTIDPEFNIHTDPTGIPPGGKNSPDNYGAQGLQKSGSYGGNDTYSGQGSTVSSSGDVKDSSGNVTGNINDEFAKGGRVGYFFGGRVNYKAGGRTDAGPNRSTASKAGVGQINEAGNKVDGGNYNNNNNDGGGGIKPTLFNNPEILNKETIFGDIPTGIGFNNNLGRYKAVMDLRNSIKNKNVEGEIEYNNTVGDFNFGGKYDTQDGATYGGSYEKNGVGVGYNNIDGVKASFEKGPFSLSTDGKNSMLNFTLPLGKKNGGRAMFKNGGLASIL